MSIIQEMQFGLWDDLREKEGLNAANAKKDLIRQRIAEQPEQGICTTENPAFTDWRARRAAGILWQPAGMLMSDDRMGGAAASGSDAQAERMRGPFPDQVWF